MLCYDRGVGKGRKIDVWDVLREEFASREMEFSSGVPPGEAKRHKCNREKAAKSNEDIYGF